MNTPIYDALARGYLDAPICRICGDVDLSIEPGEHDRICTNCWMARCAEQPELWHCYDCGDFLCGLNRLTFIDGAIPRVVCADHFEQRTGADLERPEPSLPAI